MNKEVKQLAEELTSLNLKFVALVKKLKDSREEVFNNSSSVKIGSEGELGGTQSEK